MGDLVSKGKKGSPQKIDAAVASMVALERAASYMQRRSNGGGRRAVLL